MKHIRVATAIADHFYPVAISSAFKIAKLPLSSSILILAFMHIAFSIAVLAGTPSGDEVWLQPLLDQCASTSSRTVKLAPGRAIRLSRSLEMRSNCTLQGDPSVLVAVGTKPGEFDNTNYADRLGPHAVGILVRNVNNAKISGFMIVKEDAKDGTFVKAIHVVQSSYVNLSGLIVQGFNLGGGHITISSSTQITITGNIIRSAYSNYASVPAEEAAKVQMTGIEVDNDLSVDANGQSIPSTSLTISRNHIYGFVPGRDLFNKYGDQTDGINIANPSSQAHMIAENMIEDVGEGIDAFGADLMIRNNIIRRTAYFGIKLIHGAQRAVVKLNEISYVGIAGILVMGTTDMGLQSNRGQSYCGC
jgi:hypothetical protein